MIKTNGFDVKAKPSITPAQIHPLRNAKAMELRARPIARTSWGWK